MGADGVQRCTWPRSNRVYLTLDLECDYGTALSNNTYQALDSVPSLVQILESLEIPLTCFVQTQVLDERPAAVTALQEAESEVTFHAHSHHHRPRAQTEMAAEVRTATERFRSFFGRQPTGYRVPNGNVDATDYQLFGDHGYEFDASVFPTWRPGHFQNTSVPRCPTYHPSPDMYEIPFTVLSRYLPVPTALSYCRLLGDPFLTLQRRYPPQPTIFNVHMHDLVTPDRFSDLAPWHRAIYRRNDRGFEMLETVLQQFDSAGFEFDVVDQLVGALRAPNEQGGTAP